MIENIKNLNHLYSNEKLPLLFKGGYINFGFWQEASLSKSSLTDHDMLMANSQLYQIVFNNLELKSSDRVLEVGSGYGEGSRLLKKNYNVSTMTCVDYLASHIDFSIKQCKEYATIQYIQGKAEELPFCTDSFDKIYTIEAFQHFNVRNAIAEFQRVLATKGSLVICTFFAHKRENFYDLLQLFPRPTILSDNDDEKNAALPEVVEILKEYGFSKIQIIPLGKNIWNGFDKWIRQSPKAEWNKNWLIAYQKNFLDYYLIKSERSN